MLIGGTHIAKLLQRSWTRIYLPLLYNGAPIMSTSDILEGKWNQFKGNVKQKWGKLTDDELDQIQGKRDKLIGVIQEKYGKNKMEAEKEVDEYLKTLH